VKRSPEVRPKLSGIHTTIGKEKGFCVLGALAEREREPTKKMAQTPSWLLPRKVALPVRPAPARHEVTGNDLWQKLYSVAQAAGHPNPEKMADTALRAREKSLAILAARPKLLVTKDAPKPMETCIAEKKGKGRTVPHAAFRCKAQTLEGKQCGFKATCGDFCRKHKPV